MACDVAVEYIETTIESLPQHKFNKWAGANHAPVNDTTLTKELLYVVEVYVDDFIVAIIPIAWEQVEHISHEVSFTEYMMCFPQATMITRFQSP
jgi:hypothetical protein